jgi:hypothetical protein
MLCCAKPVRSITRDLGYTGTFVRTTTRTASHGTLHAIRLRSYCIVSLHLGSDSRLGSSTTVDLAESNQGLVPLRWAKGEPELNFELPPFQYEKIKNLKIEEPRLIQERNRKHENTKTSKPKHNKPKNLRSTNTQTRDAYLTFPSLPPPLPPHPKLQTPTLTSISSPDIQTKKGAKPSPYTLAKNKLPPFGTFHPRLTSD